ncbi:large ribosomal subunit protein uL18m-like [Asterias amurensis]|uniref:large ribosomal subunit protein uL18m-like n=1 Tax=Asterias amurensis TaxID=7602 RepID=UPI003AB80AC4
MIRSMTYAVWRGMNSPLRGNLTGPSTKALRCLHTSVTKLSEAALERETESQPTNERLSENDDVSPNFLNRNPRNLERMGVARRDKGWGQSHPRRSYWHKLHFEKSNRHIKAYVQHYNGSVVVSASTKEWAIKKFVYSTSDVAAAENIGRILALRCLECGIGNLHWNIDEDMLQFERIEAFVKAMEDGGIILSEPEEVFDFRKPIDYFPEEY